MRPTVLAAAALLLVPAVHAQDAAPSRAKPFTAEETTRYMELGRRANRYFFEGQADSLLAMGDSAFAARVGGIDGIRQQVANIGDRAGMPLTVLEQKMTRRNGAPQFWWEAEFSEFTAEPLVFRWLFNEQGQLVGAGMSPKSQARMDPVQE
ncbi:MAG TPA: hypothetical protein VFN22_02145 [Gemmatimonadales bacterium]|nr:hypothetical protein [Gemmatimonadales bacterium]